MAVMIAQRRSAAASVIGAPKRGARVVTRVAQPLVQPGSGNSPQTADASMLARAGLPPTTTPFDEYKFAPIREAEVRRTSLCIPTPPACCGRCQNKLMLRCRYINCGNYDT